MRTLHGLAGAPGQALHRAVLFRRQKVEVRERHTDQPEAEIERFEQARRDYIRHLRELADETRASLGEDAAKIFQAYEVIATDDYFFQRPLRRAREEGLGVDWTVLAESLVTAAQFAAMEDPYLRERADDIGNVIEELLRRFHGVSGDGGLPQNPDEPFLVAAQDLTPEDTVRIDKAFLAGFVTERGGATSHAVILAKTLGIPAVVGVGGLLEAVRGGELLYLDGGQGRIIVDPDEAFVRQFEAVRAELAAQRMLHDAAARAPARTADGHPVAVCVNTGDADSLAAFDPEACDGVGLYRSEFLFMGRRNLPDEEVQYAAYRAIAERAGGKEVILRTLDIGGDKQLDSLQIPPEANPFLGYRAIRLCLDRRELFLTQLRAALRASAHGQVKLMLPMIVNLEELLAAKALVEQAKESLRAEGKPHDRNIPVGIMIETPAAALTADLLAAHADFFSIGTNDLIQYVTATDRMNHLVQHLYDPCNLAVLRAIHTVIRSARAAGIPVSMCGEMASDERLLPLLLGMGLDELSVAPAQVGRIKHLIGKLNRAVLAAQVDEVLALDTAAAVRERLKRLAPEPPD